MTIKKLLLLALLTCSAGLFAQDNEDEEPKDGWTKFGEFSLLFNQAAFNEEWQGGGTSNYAGNVSLSYDINYRQGKFTWDNRFSGEYGLTKIKDEEFTRKTNDRLEVNSILGRQLKDTNWYGSFFLNFRSQFAKGYEFDEDEDGNEIRTETTHFMSPGFLQFGPGFLWKKNENFKVNIAPATARFIFVDSDFTQDIDPITGLDTYEDGDYFGVDGGESSRFELGASLSGYAKFDIVKNVTMENILNLYSNYLEDPQNVDIDYTANIIMKVNKYLSANFTFQAIYDDNAVKGFQIREVLGVGFNYGF